MASRSALYRQKMKKNDPEAYQRFLEKQRDRSQAARAKEKRKWEKEPHTRAQLEEHKEILKARSEKQLQYYYKKKAEGGRQTRNSKIDPKRTPDQKRPKDMNPDELREYNSMMRRRQRDARTSQKKTADNMKQRRRRQEKKEALLIANITPDEEQKTRLPQKAYNLNHEFKSKSKKLKLTSTQYAQTALNLLNPRTPEKRTAIASLQRQHPCRVLFTEEEAGFLDLEGELGIDVQDDATVLDVTDLEPCPNSLHLQIQSFYREDAVSRMLPHARYTTKYGAARVMTMTVKAAFDIFKGRYPDVKVGLTLFQQQRPKNVRLLGSVPVESCLCVYCTNVRLKITSLNKVLGQTGRLPSEAKLLNFINCPVGHRWNKIDCIDGLCVKCSDRIRPLEVYCRDLMDIASITWKRWSRNTESGKMEPISITGSVKDLLEEFNKDLLEPSRGVSFSQHLFTAYWQFDQFKMNRRNPADGEIIMIQDFAENRKASYAEEIKSAHFGKGQITVHPMVCYYRKGEEIMRHTIIIFSDDIGHDFHAVHSFTLAALDILQREGSFQSLTMWSDGAASQYKGKGSFADLSLLTGLNVQRCFFGSEHGKGEADGETGVLSQILRRATMGGLSFANAQDMVTYLSQNYAVKADRKIRQYIVLNNINRHRPETEVQTIPGTRGYHQFRRLAQYVIQARRLACFCTACVNGTWTSCVHKDYVGEFVTHKLKPSIRTTLNEAFLADEEPEAGHGTKHDAPSQAPCNTDESPEVKIGDYLRLSCEINRLKKIFYAVVVPSPVASQDFFVRFFKQSSGHTFVFGEVPDEGLISKGPPDFYSWRIIPPEKVSVDNRGHYFFKC